MQAPWARRSGVPKEKARHSSLHARDNPQHHCHPFFQGMASSTHRSTRVAKYGAQTITCTVNPPGASTSSEGARLHAPGGLALAS